MSGSNGSVVGENGLDAVFGRLFGPVERMGP